MPWKIDENGAFVVDENKNPVFVTDSGDEKGVDYPAMIASMGEANKEAAKRKEIVRQLEAKYKPFAEIEDISTWYAEALKAIDMAKNAPDKDKAIEEQIKARVEAAGKPLNEKLAAISQEAAKLKAQLQTEKVSNAFARSQYVQEKLVSHSLAADLFAGRFSVNEDGALVASGDDGQPLYGASGLASFDEALSVLVEKSSYKGLLLKGSDKSGSGAPSNGGGGGTGGKPKGLADCKTEEERIAYLKNATS